jgi:hypothetical protein
MVEKLYDYGVQDGVRAVVTHCKEGSFSACDQARTHETLPFYSLCRRCSDVAPMPYACLLLSAPIFQSGMPPLAGIGGDWGGVLLPTRILGCACDWLSYHPGHAPDFLID